MTLTQWTGSHDNFWQPTGPTSATLPPGFYKMGMAISGPYLMAKDPKIDRAIIVDDSISHYIIAQIKKFHAAREQYKRFGQLHKRGIMLEGPAGSGKTMSANIAGKFMVDSGGVVISPAQANYFEALPGMLNRLREVHPDLPILCILEDIDHQAYVANTDLHLALLDGHWQIGNCFYIATTNHIEEIDERLTNRPKRYDEVIHVGPPSEAARRSYLNQIVPADQPMRKEAIDAMTKLSEGFMLSHLSDLMVSYLLLDHPLEEAAKRLQKMNDPSNDDDIMGQSEGTIQAVIQLPASAVRARRK